MKTIPLQTVSFAEKPVEDDSGVPPKGQRLFVGSLRVGPWSLMVGGALPVEAFYTGLNLTTRPAASQSKVSVFFKNDGPVLRWVEIDIGIDHPHSGH